MSNSPVFDNYDPNDPIQLAQAQAAAVNDAAAFQAPEAHSGSVTPPMDDMQRQLNNLQQMLTNAITPVRSNTINNIAMTPYSIHDPGTIGVTPAHKVKHIAALELARTTKENTATDWLNQMAQSCRFHRVDYPAAYASTYLIKEAGNLFNAAFNNRDPYSITWEEFRKWVLSSTLHDRLADDKLLDEVAELRQDNKSIKEYVEALMKCHGKKWNHPTLDEYPPSFWRALLKRGLHPEIKSRLRVADPSTTLDLMIDEALNIGLPLEASGVIRVNNFRGDGSYRGKWGNQRVGGAGRGQRNNFAQRLNTLSQQINALGASFNNTPPQARMGARGGEQVQNPPRLRAPENLNERETADWEYRNLLPHQRKEARNERNVCIFCGLPGHTMDTCRKLEYTRQLNTTLRLQDEEGYTINTDAIAGPNASGK